MEHALQHDGGTGTVRVSRALPLHAVDTGAGCTDRKGGSEWGGRECPTPRARTLDPAATHPPS